MMAILIIILVMATMLLMADVYHYKRLRTLEREAKCYVNINGKMEERIFLEQNLDGTFKVVAKGYEEMFNAGLNVPTESYKVVF